MAGYHDPPEISHAGNKACYRPSEDWVLIANPEKFAAREDYYSTLFHELAHSTGHSQRLARGLDAAPAPFGSTDYSKEELIAEMAAAFLNAAAGISPPTIEQSAAYIENWKQQLQGDKRLVITAASAAQKASDWILGDVFNAASENTSKPAPTPPSSHSPIAKAHQPPQSPARAILARLRIE